MGYPKSDPRWTVYYANRRHEMKRRCLAAMGGCCCICEYNRCERALHFHHLNPQEKKFSISGKGTRQSWKSIVEELRKCILVCSNCHREIEVGLIVIPEDVQRFDEAYATYVNSQGTLIG